MISTGVGLVVRREVSRPEPAHLGLTDLKADHRRVGVDQPQDRGAGGHHRARIEQAGLDPTSEGGDQPGVSQLLLEHSYRGGRLLGLGCG